MALKTPIIELAGELNQHAYICGSSADIARFRRLLINFNRAFRRHFICAIATYIFSLRDTDRVSNHFTDLSRAFSREFCSETRASRRRRHLQFVRIPGIRAGCQLWPNTVYFVFSSSFSEPTCANGARRKLRRIANGTARVPKTIPDEHVHA